VPWSGFDLINAINAWKRSEAAGRMFVAAPGGAIAKHVMGLAWRHEVSAQVFEEAAVDLGRALSAYAHARGKGERQVGSHDVSARATAGIASGCETRPTQSGWAAAIHAQ
jgi:putative transposase